jgi:hypothetical protein
LFFLFAGCCCKGQGRGEVEGDPKLPKSLAVSWHGKLLPSKDPTLPRQMRLSTMMDFSENADLNFKAYRE